MQQYIIKRVLLLIPTILLVTIIVFALIRVIPGDPALLVLVGPSGEGTFTEEQLEEMQRRLGTDRPVQEQYGVWMWGLLRGDLGDSIFYERPVTDQLGEAVPVTLELAVLGMLLSFIVAVPLGVVAALKQDTFVDHIAGLISFTGIGVPTFVVGVLIVKARPLVERFSGDGRWIQRLPIASAVVIIAVGCAITFRTLMHSGIM